MLGAPLAPMTFPPTDRPSAGFVTRFERSLRAVPDDALGVPLSLALSGCVEEAFDACLASMGPTSRHIVVSVGGVHGLIGIPDAVLHALVEFAYGGDGSEPAPLPAMPTRLAARFGYRVATMFAGAIAPALPGVEVTVLGATDVPAEAVPMKASALACGFEVTARDVSLGAIGFCVSVQALARIETGAGGALADERWGDRLENAIAGARLNVRCVLARPTLSAGAVARLVPGSVIPIPNLNEVALIAGGYRIATGIADARDGRAAIVINRTEFQL
jgi:Type III flagellar switch regulator (C-ring) FliN C-term